MRRADRSSLRHLNQPRPAASFPPSFPNHVPKSKTWQELFLRLSRSTVSPSHFLSEKSHNCSNEVIALMTYLRGVYCYALRPPVETMVKVVALTGSITSWPVLTDTGHHAAPPTALFHASVACSSYGECPVLNSSPLRCHTCVCGDLLFSRKGALIVLASAAPNEASPCHSNDGPSQPGQHVRWDLF